MEEHVLWANISTILGKDLLLDNPSYKANIDQTTGILDEDDDDDTELLCSLLTKRRKIDNPRNADDLLQKLTESEIEKHFHIDKVTLKDIISTIVPISKLSPVAITLGLWRLTTDEHYEQISRRFDIKLEECQRFIRDFWRNVTRNQRYFLKWPDTIGQKKLLEKNEKRDPWCHLKGVFAGIFVEQFDIFFECENKEISVILQIVCDVDQRILDCYVDFASTYSFKNSPLSQKLEMNGIYNEGFLIGDKNFPMTMFLLKPFDRKQGKFNRVERGWNRLLEMIDMRSKQVIYKMTKRFNTLYALETKDMQELESIFSTICCVHNMCQDLLGNKEEPQPEIFVQDRDFRLEVDDKHLEAERKRLIISKEINYNKIVGI